MAEQAVAKAKSPVTRYLPFPDRVTRAITLSDLDWKIFDLVFEVGSGQYLEIARHIIDRVEACEYKCAEKSEAQIRIGFSSVFMVKARSRYYGRHLRANDHL